MSLIQNIECVETLKDVRSLRIICAKLMQPKHNDMVKHLCVCLSVHILWIPLFLKKHRKAKHIFSKCKFEYVMGLAFLPTWTLYVLPTVLRVEDKLLTRACLTWSLLSSQAAVFFLTLYIPASLSLPLGNYSTHCFPRQDFAHFASQILIFHLLHPSVPPFHCFHHHHHHHYHTPNHYHC